MAMTGRELSYHRDKVEGSSGEIAPCGCCACSFSQKGSFFAMGFMFLAHPFNVGQSPAVSPGVASDRTPS